MTDTNRDDRHDPYLWDGSGEPDPDVVRLEETLSALRHRGTMPALPARDVAQTRAAVRLRPWLAAAAALILIAGGWLVIALGRTSWDVSGVTGAPAVDGRAISGRARLGRGEWLVTDGASRARVAVDLGCAYTLHVDERGQGLLRVTHGWVGFERDGRDTYVPEGAVCATRADKGPGTPRYEDASSGYGEALMLLDFGPPDAPGRSAALDFVLANARRRDAMTLWHLLTRGTHDERARVYDRLAALVPPPRGVTRDAVLKGNGAALSIWWDALGIDARTWWRLFKKKW